MTRINIFYLIVLSIISVDILKTYFTVASLFSSTSSTVGSINVEGYGPVYIVQSHSCGITGYEPCNITMTENSYTITGNGRLYFTDRDAPLGYPNFDIYAKMNILGKLLSYTVDMSKVGCGCNAGAYFVQMPGKDSSGNYALTVDNDYYCDGNHNQSYCPTYNLIEANKYTMAASLHSCTPSPTVPGYFPSCDEYGCETNIYNVNSSYMCPSSTCIIDTTMPYNVTHLQHTALSGLLDYILVTLSQGSQSVEFNLNICGNHNAYASRMTRTLYSPVNFVSSLWTSPNGMQFLDGLTGCSEACDLSSASVTFSNFALL